MDSIGRITFGPADSMSELRRKTTLAPVDAAHELRRLRDALKRYGHHIPPCARWVTSGDRGDGKQHDCDCGYEEFE